MTESLPGGIVSTIPWLKLTTELSNSEIDLMISTLILPLSSTTLKPSDNTELLDWLRLNEPQILENVEAVFEDVEDKVEAVNVLALRCKVFFRFFLEAISRRIWGFFYPWKQKKKKYLYYNVIKDCQLRILNFHEFVLDCFDEKK